MSGNMRCKGSIEDMLHFKRNELKLNQDIDNYKEVNKILLEINILQWVLEDDVLIRGRWI